MRSRPHLPRPKRQAKTVMFRGNGGLLGTYETRPRYAIVVRLLLECLHATRMINSRECNLNLGIDDGSIRSIDGYGDKSVVFRAGNGLVQALLANVAHVPYLRYHVFAPPTHLV